MIHLHFKDNRGRKRTIETDMPIDCVNDQKKIEEMLWQAKIVPEGSILATFADKDTK